MIRGQKRLLVNRRIYLPCGTIELEGSRVSEVQSAVPVEVVGLCRDQQFGREDKILTASFRFPRFLLPGPLFMICEE